MAAIDLANLTSSTASEDGNGVFDLLIQAVEKRIEEQYTDGRITGADYASVYLGSMQSVLSESVKFLMTEQQADKQADLIAEQIIGETKKTEQGGLIDLEKQKLQEQIDLVIAQTAAQYEDIRASTQNTNRQNLLNSKQVIKIDKDTEYVVTQNSELISNGVVDRLLKEEQTTAVTTGAIDKTNEANAQVALINANEDKTIAENLHNRFMAIGKMDKEQGFDVTYDLEGTLLTVVTGSNGLIDKQTEEVIAATVRQDSDSASKIALATKQGLLITNQTAEVLASTNRQDDESEKKLLLIDAQTIGFKSDAKQKLLKQMYEGYAINTTTDGQVPQSTPTATAGPSLDALANEILDDWASTINV